MGQKSASEAKYNSQWPRDRDMAHTRHNLFVGRGQPNLFPASSLQMPPKHQRNFCIQHQPQLESSGSIGDLSQPS